MPVIWVLVLLWGGSAVIEVSQPDFVLTWQFVTKDLMFIAVVLWAILAEREISKLQAQLKREKRKSRACSSND